MMKFQRSKAEDAIQRELMRWLKRTHPHVKAFATRNEDSRYRGDELELGLPDLIVRWAKDGVRQFLYLEIKTKKGRLNKNQIKWEAENPCLSNEFYGVGYGLTQCKEIIERTLQG